ncbi:MAG: hypothetical protein HRU82_18755 [Nitrospira sp.]|nr:MAG: hypothetical protein HRU82_18755 [Nitrospira sp.]
MLSTHEAQELERLTTTIHFQILREHGNNPDDAQELALRAIHNQLVGMVTEDSRMHGRWCLSAPIGFGKSSAVAAFLAAAFQKKLLGRITVTIAAARVEQLYDFEDAILDAGIPKDEIRRYVSVLHKDKSAKRNSDEDRSVPVLLITHEKIRRVYARPERDVVDRKPVYFLKRDLVVWDERCLVTSPVSLPLKDLKQAHGALKADHKPHHRPLIDWLDQVLPVLVKSAADMSSKYSKGLLPKSVGVAPELPAGNITSFLANIHGAGVVQKTLQDFLSMMQFRLRLIPIKGHEAMVSYFVVVPDHITNVLVLDASFKVSELSTRDASIKNLEDHHPMLNELKQSYRKTLRDVIDYSSMQFLHWNVPTGKDSVVKALNEYTKGQAKGGNPVVELIEIVKARQAAGKAVLIWTHKSSMGCKDIPQALEAALAKGGVDTMQMVNNPNRRSGKEQVQQIVVENYGKHDATNKYSYCNVVILFGVPRRQLGDISAAILGVDRELGGKLKYQEVYSARVGESAVGAQQAIGRGISRITLNGKAGGQETILFYEDTVDFNLSERLVEIYPGASWDAYQPVYAKESKTLVSKGVEAVMNFLDMVPAEQNEMKMLALKVATGMQSTAKATWSRIMDQVEAEYSNPHKKTPLMPDGTFPATPWKREGHSLVRVEAGLYGLKDETAA